MSLIVRCYCSHSFEVSDSLAGRPAQCARCGEPTWAHDAAMTYAGRSGAAWVEELKRAFKVAAETEERTRGDLTYTIWDLGMQELLKPEARSFLLNTLAGDSPSEIDLASLAWEKLNHDHAKIDSKVANTAIALLCRHARAGRALAALQSFGGMAAHSLVRALARETSEQALRDAIGCLGEMGGRYSTNDAQRTEIRIHGVPFLQKMVEHQCSAIRDAALAALADFDGKLRLDCLWTELKSSDRIDRRVRAARDLWSHANYGNAFENADVTIPVLIAGLKEGDAAVRKTAALALADVAEHGVARAAIGALVDSLADEEPYVRERGAEALVTMGVVDSSVPTSTLAAGDSKTALKTIIRSCVRSLKDVQRRHLAAEALAQLGSRAVSALTTALSLEEWYAQESAAVALTRIGKATSSTIPALVALLDSRVREVSTAAIKALRRFAPIAKPAIRPLMRFLGDQRNPDREVAETMHAIWVAPKRSMNVEKIRDVSARDALVIFCRPLLAEFQDAVSDDDERVRLSAVRALGLLGTDPSGRTVSLLTQALEDEAVREAALVSLRQLGLPAIATLPVDRLCRMLDDQRARTSVVELMGEMGNHAAGAAPRLERLLADDDAGFRQSVANALGRLGEAGLRILAESIKNDDRRVVAAADSALWQLKGPAADAALPRLLDLLGDQDCNVVISICGILRRWNKSLDRCAVALARFLGHDDPGVRRTVAAEFYVAQFGPAAKSALPKLIESLDDEMVAEHAARAIATIGPEAADAVPALIRLIADQRRSTRPSVLQLNAPISSTIREALSTIGSAGLPALLNDLSAEDKAIRQAAVSAIVSARPPAVEAIHALLPYIDDEKVGGEVLWWLRVIGSAAEPAIPVLLEVIARNGPRSAAAREVLQEICPDKVPPVSAEEASTAPPPPPLAAAALRDEEALEETRRRIMRQRQQRGR